MPSNTLIHKPAKWAFDKGHVASEWQDIARDLIYAVPFWEGGGEALEIVNGVQSTREDIVNVSWVGTDKGPAVKSAGGASDRINLGPLPLLEGLLAHSIVIYIERLADGIQDRILGSNSTDYILTWWSDDKFYWDVANTSQRATTGAISAGRYVIALINDGSASLNRKIYIDGIFQAEVTDPDTVPSGGFPYYLFDSSVNIRVFAGTIYSFMAWNRALTLPEIKKLARDPFGPFRMDEDIEWLAVAAAGGGATPHGPLGHPLWGPLAGPVAA